MKTKLIILFMVVCVLPMAVLSQGSDTISKAFLAELSLKDLMDLEIEVGTITPSSYQDAPVSLTVISKEDIQVTPARDVYDLLEIYVPGFFFVNHWQGPRMGLRGVVGDQNTSFLLLLNGKNINLKTTNGAFYELQNHELSDIESIEIISGPGAVTYGHGAIGGIINIKTISDKNDERLRVGVEANSLYRMAKVYAKGNFKTGDFNINYFAGIAKTKGDTRTEYFYVDRAHGYGYGFMGYQWGNKGLGTPALDMYGDLDGKPQVKVQVDVTYKNKLTFWTRYSDFSYSKVQQQQVTPEGEYVSPGLLGRHFISVMDYTPVQTKRFKWSVDFGCLSQVYRNVSYNNMKDAPLNDITQFHSSYAENSLSVKTVLNYNIENKLEVALGASAEKLWLGPEWGKNDSEFLNHFAAPLRFVVFDSLNSGFYHHYGPESTTQLDDDIKAVQHSLFGEVNFHPIKFLSLMLSARLDKHEFTDYAASPRLALVVKLNEKHNIKMIAQEATRFPTFNELYAFDYVQGTKMKPERKMGGELIYQGMLDDHLLLDVSAYYYTVDQIVWTVDEFPDVVGTFDMLGSDVKLKYQKSDVKAAVSYSYIKQLKWDPVKPFEAFVSNIGYDSINVNLPDFGTNRINNMPTHSFKFYINKNFNEKLRVHFNCQLNFGHGQQDMLYSFLDVHKNYGTDITREEMNEIVDVLESYGYGKPAFTSGASLLYKPDFLKSAEFQIYATNLIQFNHVRYVFQYWEGGNNRQYPRHVGFIKEPVNFGLKMIWHVGR